MRSNLFQINGYVKEPLILPDGNGPPVIHTEKVYVPVKDHPEVSHSEELAGRRALTMCLCVFLSVCEFVFVCKDMFLCVYIKCVCACVLRL